MIGIGLHIANRVVGGGVAPYVGLLDTYPNAAAAYSVRLLRGGYTGNAIRVRRSSDNAEQNIGFDGSGNLDTTALTSFCSGTNGFVTTWYDQSGNGINAINTTAANQPQIVASGSVLLLNTKPTINFDGNNDYLDIPTALLLDNLSCLNVMSFTNTNNDRVSLSLTEGSLRATYLGFKNGPNLQYVFGNQSVTNNPQDTNQRVASLFANNVKAEFYINNAGIGTALASRTGTSTLNARIGSYAGGGFECGCSHQEIIIYQVDKTADNLGLNNAINSYYGIY
jgi:hypothetical protein